MEFQNVQIEALQQTLGRKRLLLGDEQRRLLAVKDHAISREVQRERTTIVTPDTILRWHRQLVAKTLASCGKRKFARPRIRPEIVDVIVRCAQDNSIWGVDRIQGDLRNFG